MVVAGGLHIPRGVTNFDRFWEPLFVIAAAAVIFLGTL